MKKQNIPNSEEVVEGQDFADPKEVQNEKPSSHGEVGNQKGGDFSDLEESRMEHPPKHRDENGSDKTDADVTKGVGQSSGIDHQ
ncbi:hypothetical protein DHW03_13490 [Pedobacter yonginense]|uniref:Uncharacterized protein n=1 Tax=Pedobacter yonginense TaxID=651869 RepID=A0A317EP13_9SPHI|nr:hypothetical protein [Pedobacter yonginense]PWS27026.1 hypothetical protein DHW03_13490 [Pedobacter yonginense]